MKAVLLCALALVQTGPVICLDPGHPSENGVGAKGKGISEVQLVWNVALLAKADLQKAGYRVVLTKSSVNEKVTNRRRAEIANASKAALMLRLHADAGSHSGFATFFPDRKGKVGQKTGPADGVIAASKRLGPIFHRAAAAQLAPDLKDLGAKSDTKTLIGGRQGALTGSIYSEVPVVLVELCVLTNKHDDAFASTVRGQKKMSAALVAGVKAAVPIR